MVCFTQTLLQPSMLFLPGSSANCLQIQDYCSYSNIPRYNRIHWQQICPGKEAAGVLPVLAWFKRQPTAMAGMQNWTFSSNFSDWDGFKEEDLCKNMLISLVRTWTQRPLSTKDCKRYFTWFAKLSMLIKVLDWAFIYPNHEHYH